MMPSLVSLGLHRFRGKSADFLRDFSRFSGYLELRSPMD